MSSTADKNLWLLSPKIQAASKASWAVWEIRLELTGIISTLLSKMKKYTVLKDLIRHTVARTKTWQPAQPQHTAHKLTHSCPHSIQPQAVLNQSNKFSHNLQLFKCHFLKLQSVWDVHKLKNQLNLIRFLIRLCLNQKHQPRWQVNRTLPLFRKTANRILCGHSNLCSTSRTLFWVAVSRQNKNQTPLALKAAAARRH